MRGGKALIFLAFLLFCQAIFAEEGYIVYDLAEEKVVAQSGQELRLNIASNLKLFTAVVALQELGAGFRFSTKFRWHHDTLFVQAGGDPALVMEELYLVGLELKKAGVKAAKAVVIDDDLFSSATEIRALKAKNDRAYNAPVSALALNYNTYQLDVLDGKIFVKTPGDYFVVRHEDGLGDKIVTRSWHDKLLIQTGSNRATPQKTLYKRVFDPTSHFFYALCYYLDLPSNTALVRQKLPDDFFDYDGVYIHKSKPLDEILRLMNVYSSNFIAESLGCYLAQKRYGDSSMGAQVLEDFVVDSLGEAANLASCSGLGKNYLSAQTILKLLKYAWDKPFLRLDFFAGLPEMGKEGTLQSVEIPLRVKGKSGSLADVSALSGLYLGKGNKLYLFAFVANAPYASALKLRDDFLQNVLGKF